ncbi:MAG: 1-acyl-sn-glycerol-3-phosphate acyltransferase, partial [Vicingaceae bacterium]
RSDVFRKKWVSFLLKKLKLIPIYRLTEGAENLHKNQETFEHCHQILANEGALLVFPEGISKQEKKLQELRKGLARIAFSFANKYPSKSLSIVPVGVNYDKITQFNSHILLGFGFPFTLNPWMKDYSDKPNLAYQSFNIYLEQILKKHLIEIEPDKQEVFHALSEIDPSFEQNSLDRKHLIAEGIHKLNQSDTKNFEKISELSHKAEETLHSYGLSFKHFKHRVNVKTIDLIILTLLLPFTFVGLIFNWWIYFAAKGLANFLPEKHQQFHTSVRFGVATLLWLIWTITLTIALSFVSLWFLLTPFVLFFSIKTLIKTKRKIMKIKRLFALRRLHANAKTHHELIEYIKEIMNYRNENELIP